MLGRPSVVATLTFEHLFGTRGVTLGENVDTLPG